MKRKILMILAMALTLSMGAPICASALDMPNVQEIFDKKVYEASDGYKLNYRIYLPDGYSKDKEYPLLLFFHGAGSKGNDNETQLNTGVQQMFTYSGGKVRDSIVIAPQCPLLSPDTAKWVNVPNWVDGCNYSTDLIAESQQMKAVVELLGYIRENYSTDESRWYVTGLSMGGFATWDIIVRHPELWAAAVPVCGGGDHRKANVIKDMPIWTFHGDQDPTVPYYGTENIVAKLREAGSTQIKYNKLEGQKHDIWNGVYSFTTMWGWLYQQQKQMPIETDPVETDAVTEPVTENTPNATEPTTNEGGCGGSLGVSALGLAAVAGGATAVCKKKKKK
jgi:predicted peptidase